MGKVLSGIRRPSTVLIVGLIALVMALGGRRFVTRAAGATVLAKFYAPSEFTPGDNLVGYSGIGVGSLTCTSSPFVEGNASFATSLDLPNGSKVTKVTFYYTDNHA